MPQLVLINDTILNDKNFKIFNNLSTKDFIIISIRVIRKKNIIAIKYFINILKQQNSKNICYIVAGPPQSNEILDEIKNIIKEINQSNVKFEYKKEYTKFELLRLFNIANLYFFPDYSTSPNINIPIRLANVLASGIPILAPKALAIIEYINNPKFLYDPRNPDEIASKLMSIIENPEREYFKEIAIKHFSEEQINRILEDFAQFLLNLN